MKIFFVLALLAAVCAAEEYDAYVDPVRVVGAEDLGFMPEENLRVKVVDSPYAEEEVGFEPIAPSELEEPLLPNGIPEMPMEFEENENYPYRPLLDPTWR